MKVTESSLPEKRAQALDLIIEEDLKSEKPLIRIDATETEAESFRKKVHDKFFYYSKFAQNKNDLLSLAKEFFGIGIKKNPISESPNSIAHDPEENKLLLFDLIKKV